MKNDRSYQIVDSSAFENPFTISESNDSSIEQTESSLEQVNQDEAITSQKTIITETLETPKGNDSIIYGIENETSIPTRGYKPIKELENVLFTPTHKINHIDSWQTLIMLACVILLGFTRAFNINRFKQVAKSLFSYKTALEIVREEKVFFHRVNLLLSTVYILIFSLFIYHLQFLLSPAYQSNGFSFYLKIVALVVILYSIKHLFSRVLALIFDEQTLASKYIFSLSSYNSLLGIIFIPVLLLLFFTTLHQASILKYIALPILFLIFALRLFRLVVIGREKSVSYVYIFLYICSLEILPLVVLVKIFIL